MKTYLINPSDSDQVEFIREKVKRAKAELHLPSYPKILLITSLLSRPEIQALHNECDCYVSLHRCEGFGIPIAEAMMEAKPVITTGLGGPSDFIQHGRTGYIVDHMMTPVSGMPWEIYTGAMSWAEPDIMQARKLMRNAFENRNKVKEVGIEGQRWVRENLSWKTVGEAMRIRLEEICGKI